MGPAGWMIIPGAKSVESWVRTRLVPQRKARMNVVELLKKLEGIIDVHPEAKEAEVWGASVEKGYSFHITSIGYDKRHHPARMKLED